MEIKTCEEYVLQQLKDLQDGYETLAKRLVDMNTQIIFLKDLFPFVASKEALNSLDADTLKNLCIVFSGSDYEKFIHEEIMQDKIEKAGD